MREMPRGEHAIMRENWATKKQREVRACAKAATLGIALAGCEVPRPEKQETAEERERDHHAFFDAHPEFLKKVEGGEFTKEEWHKRTETLENGEEIRHDIGLDFYHVQPGDTISEIREDLARYEKYAHIRKQKDRSVSFNIHPDDLKADTWIPIPLTYKERRVSDEQFKAWSLEAIDNMKRDPEYGPGVKRILRKISEDELAASMTAIAKQESGGENGKIGSFELHRYEPAHDAFSYSYYHILMDKTGKEIRRDLDMTEGQTYHPKNAAKLFLAFLIKKGEGAAPNPETLFPLDRHAREFASFYNGKKWESINPKYASQITKFYRESL